MLLRGGSCLQKEFGEELICRKPKQQSKYNFQEKQNMFIKKNAIRAYYKTLPGQCWHSQNNVTPSSDCNHWGVVSQQLLVGGAEGPPATGGRSAECHMQET